jgi:DNA polymerase
MPTGTVAAVFATLDEARDVASTCTRCVLSEGRTNVVFGIGSPACDVMFVGEGPGAEEDRLGVPFVGRSGQLLDRLVAEEMGLTRDEIAICNTVKCRPPGNRDPKPEEIEACKPFLDAQIEHIDPRVIITLGNFAAKLLLDTKTGITKLRGTEYSFRDRVLVPTFHPAAALRGGGIVLAQLRADLVRAKLALAR